MASILQALYLASFASGLLTIVFWVRARNAGEGPAGAAHHQRFRGWMITTMLLSALAGALYVLLVTRA